MEPRSEWEYSERLVEAAHRVLVDLGQVLSAHFDHIVLVGGWVPYFLANSKMEPHTGSIDIDLVLDARQLSKGVYAELLEQLLATRRYRKGNKPFRLMAEVDLEDGAGSVWVDVDFLAPQDVKLDRNRPPLIESFRVLQADGCGRVFNHPQSLEISGKMINGTSNIVRLKIASLADFLVMKALALGGRDKPKDAYDLCYCLDNCPEGMATLATCWKECAEDEWVVKARAVLSEKFLSVDSYGHSRW